MPPVEIERGNESVCRSRPAVKLVDGIAIGRPALKFCHVPRQPHTPSLVQVAVAILVKPVEVVSELEHHLFNRAQLDRHVLPELPVLKSELHDFVMVFDIAT